MALNIQDYIWTDSRVYLLQKKLGQHEAIGQLVALWKVARDFWKRGELIPDHIYQMHGLSEDIISVGLAERREGGIYAKGSEDQFSWLRERVESGRRGGAKRAANSRQQKQEFAPSKRQANASNDQANASLSLSLSPSLSKTKTKGEPSGSALVIGNYVRLWQSRYGSKERPDVSGKTQGQIAALLKDRSPKELVELLTTYLGMNDDWFKTRCHDFGTFHQNITKIAAMKAKAPSPQVPAPPSGPVQSTFERMAALAAKVKVPS